LKGGYIIFEMIKLFSTNLNAKRLTPLLLPQLLQRQRKLLCAELSWQQKQRVQHRALYQGPQHGRLSSWAEDLPPCLHFVHYHTLPPHALLLSHVYQVWALFLVWARARVESKLPVFQPAACVASQ
jgi:hypothetical protein